jgi:hypothetical protein
MAAIKGPVRKACANCGETFEGRCGAVRYCSDNCHIAANAERRGECLIWRGGTDKDGYPIARLRGVGRKRVTRVVFEEHHGPLATGQMACHSCDTPSCIEPSHLFAGTALDNKSDCVAKGRHVHGTACHTNKLTEDQVRAILSDTRDGATIGREYGVDRNNVYAIKQGKTWKHLIA